MLQVGHNPITIETDLLELRAGPAGVTAPEQARELEAKVTLLEARLVRGASFHRGPAPVRTLARAVWLAREWFSWAGFD